METFDVDVRAAARRLAERRRRRREAVEERLARARAAAARIIDHIATTYQPRSIHVWGSLVRTERFSAISDIDIAIDGFPGGETELSRVRDYADHLTDIPLDLVVLERLDPGRVELITRFGRRVWPEDSDAG